MIWKVGNASQLHSSERYMGACMCMSDPASSPWKKNLIIKIPLEENSCSIFHPFLFPPRGLSPLVPKPQENIITFLNRNLKVNKGKGLDLHPALATSIREKNAGAVPRRYKIERWRTFFKCSENIPSSIGIKAPLKATEPLTFEGFNENQIFFQALCFSLRGFPGEYNWSRGRTWGTWLEFLLPQ